MSLNELIKRARSKNCIVAAAQILQILENSNRQDSPLYQEMARLIDKERNST